MQKTGERKFDIKADTEEDLEMWLLALQRCCSVSTLINPYITLITLITRLTLIT